MRRPGWAWLALSSLLLAPLSAATRPRYGGSLTLELSAGGPAEGGVPAALVTQFAETLVRWNAKGEIEPLLAVNWQHDADRRRWRFSLRPKVVFHDGEALTGANAAPLLAAALKKEFPDISVTAGGQTLVVQFERGLDLPAELARARYAVLRQGDNGAPIGTGPFRVTAWEPGRKLALAAFDDYWGGRPYLDSVVVNLGSTRGREDVVDVPIGPSRRVLPEGTRTWTSPVRELVALVLNDAQPALRQALALAVDRGPIVSVLAQRKGEAASGLLPQWISGYEFVFAGAPDVARAKALVSQLRPAPLALAYPANDAFARSVAERIALNARDAGIVLQPVQAGTANLRLIRWRLESADAAAELARLAAALGISVKPDTPYEMERALLEDGRVIPIVHLPDVYGIAPRVHHFDAAQKHAPLRLHLEDVWVEP